MSVLEPILVARSDRPILLLPQMVCRHGLIAGATGTGKTVTLQTLAESLSDLGVPVFLADVKGDLAGISQPGGQSAKVRERLAQLGLSNRTPRGCPVTFWDVWGQAGHPVRTTVCEMGPRLLARLLQLNDTQAGALQIAFRAADEEGLLLLDLKDLRSLLQHVAENAANFSRRYGLVSAASLGAIQRSLLALESQGGDRLFGEPALNLDDFLQTDPQGRGVVNILSADRLLQAPMAYSTLLLWFLSELFERLPEVGDAPKPRLVFFFDEAHLLFRDLPPALLQTIEQVVRLIRSKGVGVFFATQNPRDIPDNILGQLGNRFQHALRAYTPRDQKAVQAAAETFRANPKLDTAAALSELAVGEALVSTLGEQGEPSVVERASIVPPRSQLGPIPTEERRQSMEQSLVAGVYDQPVDRESAYERLTHAVQTAPPTAPFPTYAAPSAPPARPAPRGRPSDDLMTTMAKSAVRTIGSSIGRELIRGLLGSLLGGRKR